MVQIENSGFSPITYRYIKLKKKNCVDITDSRKHFLLRKMKNSGIICKHYFK